MSDYIATPAYYDRMPLDISFVFEKERPAGKHGFIHADGDNFRFEDGTQVKFWGVIFNGGANFPEHDYSEKVAKRLSMAGCNLVRLHQLDAEWGLPNIYQTYAGPSLTSTRNLSVESLDRLDYLIHCLKQQGIYVAIDMMTYRKFKSGDGVSYAELLTDTARGYSMYDPVMIRLQKEFMEKFWSHYNPYTGLLYKDDPAFVMCTIANENDVFHDYSHMTTYHRIKYYDDMLRDMFHEWLLENKIDYDAYSCELFTKDEPMIRFKTWLTEKYYQDMYDYLRQLGVKIPITGTNWIRADAMIPASRLMDFTDMHKYVYDWHWDEKDKLTFNKAITDSESIIGDLAKAKISGKPVFFSEWDIPWPNSYRALGAPYFAAVACLQNWSGMTVHTYSYGTYLDKIDRLGKEISSSTVGGFPYREGIFSVWNDPAKFGLFYHSALMLRRSDISQAQKCVGITISNLAARTLTAYNALVERHRICTALDINEQFDQIVEDTEKPPREEPNFIRSDNGQLWRNLKRSIGAVDSPRTKIAYGFIGRAGAEHVHRGDLSIRLDGMTVDSRTDFGVVALSSLTDDPIEKSHHMLLSTIGRARNTGAQFDGEKMIDVGHAPILSEIIEADIHIRTNVPKLRVWGVNAEGYYVGMLDAVYEDGWLKFHTGTRFPAQYYLITAE